MTLDRLLYNSASYYRPKHGDPPEMAVVEEMVERINRAMVPNEETEIMYVLKYGWKPQVKNRVVYSASNDQHPMVDTNYCAIEVVIPDMHSGNRLLLSDKDSFPMDFMWKIICESSGRTMYYMGHDECVHYHGVLFILGRSRITYKFGWPPPDD